MNPGRREQRRPRPSEPPPDTAARTQRGGRLPRYLVTVLLLGLGIHVLLPQIASLQRSLEVVRGTIWWFLGLATLAQIASYIGSGLLLSSLANLGGRRVSSLYCLAVSLASGSVGMVAGGILGVGAASYQWLRDRNVQSEHAALAGSLPVWLNNGLMALLASIGLVGLLLRGSLSAGQIIGYVLVLALITLVFGAVIWAQKHRESSLQAAERIAQWVARLRRRAFDPQPVRSATLRAYSAWDLLRAGAWREPLWGAALNHGFDLLCLYWLFRAARYPIDIGVLLTGYGLPLLLGKLVLLPGGVGVMEASMTALYVRLAVPSDVVVVVILVYRLVSFWLPSILGFLLIPYLNSNARRPPRPTAGQAESR